MPRTTTSSGSAFLPLVIRRARRADQTAISAFVERERLDPNNLQWRNFLVAVADGRIVGTVQLRGLPDGLCELGSLAVAPELRGRGIATRLIKQLLAEAEGPVEMITCAKFAAHYERFGFRRIGRTRALVPVRKRYLIGQSLGGLSRCSTATGHADWRSCSARVSGRGCASCRRTSCIPGLPSSRRRTRS